MGYWRGCDPSRNAEVVWPEGDRRKTWTVLTMSCSEVPSAWCRDGTNVFCRPSCQYFSCLKILVADDLVREITFLVGFSFSVGLDFLAGH